MTSPSSQSAGLSNLDLLPSAQLPEFEIDGVQPRYAVAPADPGEVGEVLRQAQSHKLSVIPFGSGTKRDWGNLLRGYDVAVSTSRLDRVSEYEPQDLVVKVQAGCRLSVLQKALAPDRLWLPLDPPRSQEGTLGGLVATRASGPSRFGYGTIRDYLLGLTVVQADGTKTKFGAKVVKNVTGYDLCKLYAGSFGTLGVMTDFYFKLKPMPPFCSTVVVLVKQPSDGSPAVRQLFSSPLMPLCFEWLSPEAFSVLNDKLALVEGRTGFAFFLRFGDVEKAVRWQIQELERLWEPFCAKGVVMSSDSAEQDYLWGLLREDQPFLRSGLTWAKIRISALPSDLTEISTEIQEFRAAWGGEVLFKAHAGNGVFQVYCGSADLERDGMQLAEYIGGLRQRLKAQRGSAVLEWAPRWLKERIDVWGLDSKERILMQRIKARYDPTGILNPGRFVV
ncbi:MAG: FAD-binding oxidoreductase [Acidobacteriota bacterium]